jgi:hypothetical protein
MPPKCNAVRQTYKNKLDSPVLGKTVWSLESMSVHFAKAVPESHEASFPKERLTAVECSFSKTCKFLMQNVFCSQY